MIIFLWLLIGFIAACIALKLNAIEQNEKVSLYNITYGDIFCMLFVTSFGFCSLILILLIAFVRLVSWDKKVLK
jgi:uncharacterized membrane protein